MRIRRFTAPFIIALALGLALLAGATAGGFSAHITYEKCAALGLPVLAVDTDAGRRITSKEKYVTATYTLEGFSGGCKIRGHGNTTWVTRELYKKPYLLKLDKDAPLLGMAPAAKWVLIANTADKTSLRNLYALRLGESVWNRLAWTPKTRFITLFLNNRYEGLYALTEKVEILPGRLELDAADGSQLYEVNSRANRAWNFRTPAGVPVSLRSPEDVPEDDFREKKQYIEQAEEALLAQDGGWADIIDAPSFIDWYLVNEFTKNHDAKFQSSCFLYRDGRDGRLRMGPLWDFDIACGNISWDGCDRPEGWWVRDAAWYARLFEDPAFAKAAALRWKETRAALGRSLDWLRAQADALAPAAALNDAAWRSIGRRQWPHAPGWRQRKTYRAEVDYLLGWLERRLEWMDGAMAELAAPGGGLPEGGR